MKIDRITIYHVPLTSHVGYYMSDGKSCETVDTVVVRLDTDDGLAGWGEVCPIPRYLPAYSGGVAPGIEVLSPVLLGADPIGPESLMARCDAHLPGHPYVKSAIDIALWDLTGKVAGLPVYRLLGGRRVERAPLYQSISCLPPDDMAAIAAAAYDRGIRQFQVKVGADGDWTADVARIRAVRAAVGAEPLVYIDWNCGATTLTAIRVCAALTDLDVMLEQPCESLEACSEVRKATGRAMKIDEAAHDMGSLLRAHAFGCMDVAALKLSKFGGLSAAQRARDLCVHLNTMMVIEDTWGSDIATAALAHLAVATPERYLLNTCDLSRYVSPRLAGEGVSIDDNSLAPREFPGLGVEPEPSVLGAPYRIIK